ncbi:MAG: hypothetical protein AB7H92_14080 [Microbacteriaceae bacterium]
MISARCLIHVGLAAFGLFTAALNLVGPNQPVIYLVAGAAAGPAAARFVVDRRKVLPGYYGPAAPRADAWCQTGHTPPHEPHTAPGSDREAKLWRLATDPRTPDHERDAALRALLRLRGGVAA